MIVAKTIFYSLAALVRKILFCHSKIKFISSRHRIISSMYFTFGSIYVDLAERRSTKQSKGSCLRKQRDSLFFLFFASW